MEKKPMVITNAKVMPVDRPVIENGYVRIENGIIVELGEMPYKGTDEQ